MESQTRKHQKHLYIIVPGGISSIIDAMSWAPICYMGSLTHQYCCGQYCILIFVLLQTSLCVMWNYLSLVFNFSIFRSLTSDFQSLGCQWWQIKTWPTLSLLESRMAFLVLRFYWQDAQPISEPHFSYVYSVRSIDQNHLTNLSWRWSQ